MSGRGLRRLMALEAAVETPDGAGGLSRTWQVLGQHWVQLTRVLPRADSKDAFPGADLRFRALVAASPEGAPSRPVAGQRFRDGAVVYRIQAVVPAPQDRLSLQCELIREVLR